MNTWQAGTMLHPGAQRSEHRTTRSRPPETPMDASMTAERQSGHQSGAWSRHHPGSSFPLARTHDITTNAIRPNNLKPVFTFRGNGMELGIIKKYSLINPAECALAKATHFARDLA